MLKKTLDILVEIKNTASTNEKIEIVRCNFNNEILKKIFQFVYDKSFSTGIAKKKIKNIDGISSGITFRTIDEVFDYLKDNQTGSNEMVANVKNYVEIFCDNHREVLYEIFMKDLKIGINEKGINKAIPGLVEKKEPMLAFKYNGNEHRVKDKLLYLTTKLDGNRINIFNYADGRKIAKTRTGKIIEGLEAFLEKLILPCGHVCDGEIIAIEGNTSAEKYKKTSEIMRKKGEKTGIKFNFFDLIPIDEFDKGKSSDIYSERRKVLDLYKKFNSNYQEVVEILSVVKGDDPVIFDLLDKATNAGEEGLMGNVADAYYECKRSYGILKFKKFEEVDILCTGVLEGQGEKKGTLGSIEVDFKGVKVKVGSGFDDETRERIFNNKDEIIGKIVTVKYFEVTKDGSLRFPVFKDIRLDKKAPSYN